VGGGLDDDDLQGGAHAGGLEVPAARGAVARADDDVGVDLGPAVVQRDVAGERQDFHLFEHRDVDVGAAVPIEVGEGRVAERADAGEVTGGQVILAGEVEQPGDRVVVGVEDDGERPLARVFVDQSGVHASLRARATLLRCRYDV
jgi:hypothetical protein